MFQRETILRKLQKLLSGKGTRLFDNQVSFYNALFGMTDPEAFPEALVRELEGCRKRPAIESFFRNGLDNSSSNIGKHINDEPGMGIPRHHCLHFSQDQYQTEICRRLKAIIGYRLARLTENPIKQAQWRRELLAGMKETLSCTSRVLDQTETADDALLALIIYEVIRTHLGARRSPEQGERIPPDIGKIDLDSQIREYFRTCDCYEATSADFFFALRRMARSNVIAASNLAGFYYVGTAFIVKNEAGGPNGRYIVEKNLEQAAYYFKLAASSQPPYGPALYSYGYMLLHGETGELSREERLALAEQYYRQAARLQFHHAVSGLGDLALLRTEDLLNRQEETVEAVTVQLAAAAGYYARAEKLGSFWGPIRMAQFLDEEKYAPYRKQALIKAGLSGEWTAREKWKAAVEMGNVFAMEQLALLDLRLGEYDEAREMLKRASDMNYPNASLHLALVFFSSGGQTPDTRAFYHYLEKAAHEGSARASVELRRLALEQSRRTETAEGVMALSAQAEHWFEKAEEQNHLCFDKETYDLLRQYRRESAE